MEFSEVIKSRRSIRKFKPDTIPDSYIYELLDAARHAPSGLNLQPWRYLVVKDKSIRDSIAQTTASVFVANAPVIIICCIDTKAFETTGTRVKELYDAGAFSEDTVKRFTSKEFLEIGNSNEFWIRSNLMLNGAISIEHIALKASDLGLGSCWVGSFDNEKLKKIIDLEAKYDVIAIMPIGYPAHTPSARPRLSVDEILLKEI